MSLQALILRVKNERPDVYVALFTDTVAQFRDRWIEAGVAHRCLDETIAIDTDALLLRKDLHRPIYEVSVPEYTRAPGSFGILHTTESNINRIQFPDPKADWGVVTYVAIMRRMWGGEMLDYGELPINVHIHKPQYGPSFLPGNLKITP